jgi:hypothetical protein
MPTITGSPPRTARGIFPLFSAAHRSGAHALLRHGMRNDRERSPFQVLVHR